MHRMARAGTVTGLVLLAAAGVAGFGAADPEPCARNGGPATGGVTAGPAGERPVVASAGAALGSGVGGRNSTVESGRTTSLPGAASARQVFEQFRALSGEWIGKSTKGWTDRAAIRVIAAGSVVVSTSDFEAHPDETMMTMYHLDGDRLLLTHYCVAKNQPRLQMTSAEDGGRKVSFTFLDATNLASRNQGHMDRVEFRFQDPEHYSSRWTFYQDGREEWMEEIHYQRIR